MTHRNNLFDGFFLFSSLVHTGTSASLPFPQDSSLHCLSRVLKTSLSQWLLHTRSLFGAEGYKLKILETRWEGNAAWLRSFRYSKERAFPPRSHIHLTQQMTQPEKHNSKLRRKLFPNSWGSFKLGELFKAGTDINKDPLLSQKHCSCAYN